MSKLKCLNPIPLNVGVKKKYYYPSPYTKKKGTNIFEKTSDNPDIQRKLEDNIVPTSILAPCGKCFICRRKRISEWYLRLTAEYNLNYADTDMLFMTLTYDPEYMEDPSLNYTDIQLFLKRLRKRYSNDKLKYIVVGEYGMKSLRKHWHIIIFGFKKLEKDFKNTIYHLWNKGFVVTKKSDVNALFYLLKYSFKQYLQDKDYFLELGLTPPIFRVSQGFGKDFAFKYKDRLLLDNYIKMDKFTYSIPRYFIRHFKLSGIIDGDSFIANYASSLRDYFLSIKNNYSLRDLELPEQDEFNNNMIFYFNEFKKNFKDIANNINIQLYNKFIRNFVEAV